MFGAWLTATDKEIAEALWSQRTILDPDYTTGDSEDPTGPERYEAHQGTWEDHPHHHTNR